MVVYGDEKKAVPVGAAFYFLTQTAKSFSKMG